MSQLDIHVHRRQPYAYDVNTDRWNYLLRRFRHSSETRGSDPAAAREAIVSHCPGGYPQASTLRSERLRLHSVLLPRRASSCSLSRGGTARHVLIPFGIHRIHRIHLSSASGGTVPSLKGLIDGTEDRLLAACTASDGLEGSQNKAVGPQLPSKTPSRSKAS